jgi:hypothetical protein
MHWQLLCAILFIGFTSHVGILQTVYIKTLLIFRRKKTYLQAAYNFEDYSYLSINACSHFHLHEVCFQYFAKVSIADPKQYSSSGESI